MSKQNSTSQCRVSWKLSFQSTAKLTNLPQKIPLSQHGLLQGICSNTARCSGWDCSQFNLFYFLPFLISSFLLHPLPQQSTTIPIPASIPQTCWVVCPILPDSFNPILLGSELWPFSILLSTWFIRLQNYIHNKLCFIKSHFYKKTHLSPISLGYWLWTSSASICWAPGFDQFWSRFVGLIA